MVRVRVIDMLRGVCMFYIVFGHIAQFWLTWDDYWIFSFVFNFSEVMGANCFLLLSGVAFTFSIRSRQEKERLHPKIQQPPLWKEVHARTLFLFLFAFLFNLMSGSQIFWIYFILQTIAMSRLLMLPFMKRSVRWRIYMTGVVIVLSPISYWLLYPQAGANIVQVIAFMFVFNQPFLDVILPFFAFFVAGTVIGEFFWERRNTLFQAGYNEMKHLLARYGGILFASGIFMGMFVTDWDYGWVGVQFTNLNPLFNFSGVPLFLIRGTVPWVLMSMGAILCVLAFLCHIEHYPRIRYGESRFLSILSTQSLTIYFLHYASAPLFYRVLDGYNLWIPNIAFCLLLWGLCWLWVKKYNAKYSIEWIMGVGIKALLRNYYKKGQTVTE